MYELNNSLYFEEREEGMFFIDEAEEKVFILGTNEVEVMRLLIAHGIEKTASYVKEHYTNVGEMVEEEIKQFAEDLMKRKVLVASAA